ERAHVAAEFLGGDRVGLGKERPQAVQRVDVGLDAQLDDVARLGGLALEAQPRLLLDVGPGEEEKRGRSGRAAAAAERGEKTFRDPHRVPAREAFRHERPRYSSASRLSSCSRICGSSRSEALTSPSSSPSAGSASSASPNSATSTDSTNTRAA